MKKFFLFFKCQHQKKKKKFGKNVSIVVFGMYTYTQIEQIEGRQTPTGSEVYLVDCCWPIQFVAISTIPIGTNITHTHTYIRLFRPFNLLARGTRQMNQAKEPNQTYAHTFGRWVMIRRRPLVKSIIVIILL